MLSLNFSLLSLDFMLLSNEPFLHSHFALVFDLESQDLNELITVIMRSLGLSSSGKVSVSFLSADSIKLN